MRFKKYKGSLTAGNRSKYIQVVLKLEQLTNLQLTSKRESNYRAFVFTSSFLRCPFFKIPKWGPFCLSMMSYSVRVVAIFAKNAYTQSKHKRNPTLSSEQGTASPVRFFIVFFVHHLIFSFVFFDAHVYSFHADQHLSVLRLKC